MKSTAELKLRMDLVAIAIGYNVPRQLSVTIVEEAVAKMRRAVEGYGMQIRESRDISHDWGAGGVAVYRKRRSK